MTRSTTHSRRAQFVVAAALLAAAGTVRADLTWGNSQAISNELGVALAADETNYLVGCFAQLIFAGANAQADPFVPSGTGVSGDDVVRATMFAGMDDPFYMDGFFPLHLAVQGSAGNGYYYVRVYNAPNPNFPMGTNAPIPSAATYYWQSELHEYVHNETLPDDWDFAPEGGQTLIPIVIPEPGVAGLFAVGLGAVALWRRRVRVA